MHVYIYIYKTHTHRHTHTHTDTRTAEMATNSDCIRRRVTKGCPQGSCCGPGFWNVLYNSLLKTELTSYSTVIAFADDIIILTRGMSVVEFGNEENSKMGTEQ